MLIYFVSIHPLQYIVNVLTATNNNQCEVLCELRNVKFYHHICATKFWIFNKTNLQKNDIKYITTLQDRKGKKKKTSIILIVSVVCYITGYWCVYIVFVYVQTIYARKNDHTGYTKVMRRHSQ